MSISTLARRNGLDGQTLRKQYKEVISGFRTWDQLEHADEYMLFPENLGPDLSLDETCLSNGVVYTILTDKSAHGRKGAIVAMVRGVSSHAVVEVLRGIPRGLREEVKTVTTDLSSAMMLTARKAFPKAQLINDRFHVQKLASEAVDSLRVRHRWAVLEEENKAVAEHNRKLAKAKTPQQKQAVGKWQPKFMENGETMSQIMHRSRHILFTHPSKWNEQQAQRAAILFKSFPDLEQAYGLCMELTRIFNRKTIPDVARLNLARWYDKVERFGSGVFNKLLNTFRNNNATIVNYFEARLTNASAESFNAKIKAFRSQLRGVADVKFFMYRLATQYA